jgi:Glycine rich protein
MGRVRIGSGVAILAMVAASAGTGAAALAAGGSGIAGATTLDACPPAVISGTTATVTCSYNGTDGTDGSPQTWTVPAGVTQATFDVYGAQGGGGAPSGPGGEAEGTLPVVPGSTLQINVGGQAIGTAGGFNGGGNASIGGGPTGGGGASDVRDGSYGLADRLVVAGGGGGDGYTEGYGVPVGETAGGAGGGANGGDPTVCSSGSPPITTPCGAGGTNTAGGAAGQTVACDGFPGVQVLAVTAPTDGSFGIGGSGGSVTCTFIVSADPTTYETLNVGGAGGGGGWFGGGGGAVAAEAYSPEIFAAESPGGGGSGYIDPSATNASMQTGVNAGNGKVVITYTVPGGPFSILTTSLPDGTVGQPYAFSLQATGGNPPYTWWYAKGGDLPRGLHFSTAGVLSGTTKKAGNYSITFRVRDTKVAGLPVNRAHTALTVTITVT